MIVMKTIANSIIIFALTLVSFNAYSQDFYLRTSVDYTGETGNIEFNNANPNCITGIQQSTDISTDGTTIIVKALTGTLGAGFKFNIIGGYM
jgi:hypothetical protein